MAANPEEKPSKSNMPLYPDEEQIARAVLGPKRARQWRSIAKFLEDKEGLPRIDIFMGGRYWPAVEFYFKQRNGMHSMPERPSSRHIYVPTPDRIRTAPSADPFFFALAYSTGSNRVA